MCHQKPNQLVWLQLVFHHNKNSYHNNDSSWCILWLQTTTINVDRENQKSQTFQRDHTVCFHPPQFPFNTQQYASHQVDSAALQVFLKHGLLSASSNLQLTDYLHLTYGSDSKPYLCYVFNVKLCKDSSHIQSINVIKNMPTGLDIGVASNVSWYHAVAVAVQWIVPL